MGGVVKAVTKPIKKVVKSVSKVVKKVAKTVVNVGKKVVKGVSKAVGKITTKLGPVASIALMAVGGYFLGPMINGMWGSMGISSAIGQQMATGALTGFVTSGGDVKAALMGGAMAGLGSVAGSVAKGGTLQSALSAQGTQSFTAGLAESGQRWSGFTSAISNTGKTITDGIGNFFENLGGGDVEKGAEFGFSPDSTKAQQINASMSRIKSLGGTNEMINQQLEMAGSDQLEQYKVLSNLESSLKTDISGTAGFSKDIYADQLANKGTYVGPDITTAPDAIGRPGDMLLKSGSQLNDPYWQVAADYNVVPGSEQHLQLLEQDYGQYKGSLAAWDPVAGKITTDPSNLMKQGQFTFDAQQSFWEPDVRAMQSAALSQSTTPEYMTQDMGGSLLDKGKKAMDALSKGYQAFAGMQPTGTGTAATPSWVTSVPAGDTLLGKAGGIGGTAGGGVFTPEQEQYQKQLLAAIRQQEEMAKQRAAAGWGVA